MLACSVLVVMAVVPERSAATVRNASNAAELKAAFDASTGGDTILLASGSYGLFHGGMKSGMVTIQPAPGASASMSFDFNPASNITLDGLTITEGGLNDARTKNITLRNSDVPGQIVVRSDALQNANILFDHNVHRDWNQCDLYCSGGRVSFPGRTDQPLGMTIQNSVFRGGASDGIATGANGLRIINNTFQDIVRNDVEHVDALQLIGASNTVIRGNYFSRVPTSIMGPDGNDHNIIEDNVFAADQPDGYPYAIVLGSDDGSIVRHNTLQDGPCSFNARCGFVRLGAKDNDDRGRGTIIKDNVLGGVLLDSDGSSFGEISHNVIANSAPSGVATIKGLPTFVGGAHPTSYAGFALASGSLGKGTASDGLDAGIRLSQGGPPGATSSGLRINRIRIISSLRGMAKTGKLHLRVRSTAAGTVIVGGRVTPKRPRHKVKSFGLGHKRVRFAKAGTRKVTLRLNKAERRKLRKARRAIVVVRAFTDLTRDHRLKTRRLVLKKGR